MIKYLFPLLLLVTLGAGCGSKPVWRADPAHTNSGANAEPMPTRDEVSKIERVSSLAEKRVLLTNKDALKPGSISLSFVLYGQNGKELRSDDLKTVHEKKLHLLIVRDDMNEFRHVHPEYKNAEWSVDVALPKRGGYQMYLDIAPYTEEPSVLRVPLAVGGATIDPNPPAPNPDFSAMAGGVQANLLIDEKPKTQETMRWTYLLTKDGQPVKDIRPYLGAFGHVVQLRHGDPDDFFHVHPVTQVKPEDGKVIFEGTFPLKGRYTLYAQFNIAGEIVTFPITLDVENEGAPTKSQNHMMN
jgi:hypothetical protein